MVPASKRSRPAGARSPWTRDARRGVDAQSVGAWGSASRRRFGAEAGLSKLRCTPPLANNRVAVIAAIVPHHPAGASALPRKAADGGALRTPPATNQAAVVAQVRHWAHSNDTPARDMTHAPYTPQGPAAVPRKVPVQNASCGAAMRRNCGRAKRDMLDAQSAWGRAGHHRPVFFSGGAALAGGCQDEDDATATSWARIAARPWKV